jgi:hypothetical protein
MGLNGKYDMVRNQRYDMAVFKREVWTNLDHSTHVNMLEIVFLGLAIVPRSFQKTHMEPRCGLELDLEMT